MKKLFALVATASLMFSCSQEVTPDLEKLPINISVGQQTRANDSTYESGDEVGIYVVNYVGSTAGSLSTTGNQVDNMHFTYSNNAWAPDETIYWKDKTTAADFYAYYPYSESPNISEPSLNLHSLQLLGISISIFPAIEIHRFQILNPPDSTFLDHQII